MLELLEQLFRQVRNYAQSERLDRERVYLQSPRHTTMQFDRDAEDIIIKGLMDSGHGFEVITEERATFSTVEKPDYRILIDPLDGSENVARGIMAAAVSLAVLPIGSQVSKPSATEVRKAITDPGLNGWENDRHHPVLWLLITSRAQQYNLKRRN